MNDPCPLCRAPREVVEELCPGLIEVEACPRCGYPDLNVERMAEVMKVLARENEELIRSEHQAWSMHDQAHALDYAFSGLPKKSG